AARMGSDVGIARAGIGLGAGALYRGDPQLARKLLEAELPRLRSLPDKKFLVFGLLRLGDAYVNQDRREAAASYREAQRLADLTSDWAQEGRALYGLGRVAFEELRFQDAYEYWTRALETY